MISFLACVCNEQGSIFEACDKNGICSCKDKVIGKKCTDCISPGYHGVPDCTTGKQLGQFTFYTFWNFQDKSEI